MERINDSKLNSPILEKDRMHGCSIHCLSWTAIFAGALVGLGLSFLLNLFSVAIGLTAYNTSEEGMTSLVVGGFIAMVFGVMAVSFVSGWVSGILGRSHCCNRCLGALYGFGSWSLILIFSILLASNAGQFVTSQFQAFTNPKGVFLKITSNPESKAITTETTKANASNENTTTKVVVNDEKAANLLGKSLLLMFILFFVAAITSSYGGYVGMYGCRCKKCETCCDKSDYKKLNGSELK